MELNEQQRACVRMFSNSSLSVITGGPGTGKTTVVRALLKRVKPCLLLATTGTAADRLTQTTGQTAHVVKKLDYSSTETLNGHRGANVVVDEASMLSTDDLVRLIQFLRPNRLVLVGDSMQLPCVEGLPSLTTLLACAFVPRTRLVYNHRRAGDASSRLARLIARVGDADAVNEDWEQDDAFDASLRVCITYSKEGSVAACARVFQEKGRAAQMLTFTNDMCARLNAATEDTSRRTVPDANKASATKDSDAPKAPMREGDRVVCTQNLYGEDRVLLVGNGCTGVLLRTGVRYDNGFEDLRFRTQFELSRCMTVHKSQGNEFDAHGVVCLTGWANNTIPAELVYTALTRFKRDVTVVGTRELFELAFLNSRYTLAKDEKLVGALCACDDERRRRAAPAQREPRGGERAHRKPPNNLSSSSSEDDDDDGRAQARETGPAKVRRVREHARAGAGGRGADDE